MRFGNEIKVGVVVLFALGMLYYGYNFLKGENIFHNHRQYYSEYVNVDGLTRDNPVQINGFNVGKVNSIGFHPGKPGTLIVGLLISDDLVEIPQGSTARIVNLDLLGSKALQLELNREGLINIEVGDTLVGANENSLTEEFNIQLGPVKDKAMALISQMDTAISIIKKILDEDATKNLGASFESIQRTFKTFEDVADRVDTMMADNTVKISRTMNNLESITSNVRKNNKEITNILTNVSTFTDSLATVDMAGTLKNAELALADMSALLQKINNGHGTLGQLINNDSLYLHLDQAIIDMDKLLVELNSNPRKFFKPFGQKQKRKKK